MSDEKVFKAVPPEQVEAAWDAIRASGLDATQFKMDLVTDWMAPKVAPLIKITRGQKSRSFTSDFSDKWIGDLRVALASGQFND